MPDEDNPRRGTHLRDAIIERQVRSRRQEFIDSLPTHDILRLAASYRERSSVAPVFFRDPVRGSYNMCYFVEFPASPSQGGASPPPPPPDRWVVRVPLDPYLAFGSAAKLESEMAAMELLSQRTTIPVPRVIAYAIEDASKPVPTFAILEFMEGEKLLADKLRDLEPARKANFQASLADIFMQLRRLEFDSIGCLVHRADGSIGVGRPPASIEMNAQALEGLQPTEVIRRYVGQDGTLRSAKDYLHMLLDLGDNTFAKCRFSIEPGTTQGQQALYHLHLFRRFAEGWQAREDDDKGPFVLVHGDFEAFNLLIGEDGTIVAVLDWEWSRVVPRRHLIPPIWLYFNDPSMAAMPGFYWLLLDNMKDFLRCLRDRELERYGNTMLSDEWSVGKNDAGFMAAASLDASVLMESFARQYIEKNAYNREGLEERIEEFMQEDPARGLLVEQKLRDSEAYCTEFDRLADAEKTVAQRIYKRCHKAFNRWNMSLIHRGAGPGPARFVLPGLAFVCGTGAVVSLGLAYMRWSRRP